jgi:hypothetical protein
MWLSLEVRIITASDSTLDSGWEIVLCVIACILLGIAAIFQLDNLFASPGRRSGNLKAFRGCDQRVQRVMRDPDGRPF